MSNNISYPPRTKLRLFEKEGDERWVSTMVVTKDGQYFEVWPEKRYHPNIKAYKNAYSPTAVLKVNNTPTLTRRLTAVTNGPRTTIRRSNAMRRTIRSAKPALRPDSFLLFVVGLGCHLRGGVTTANSTILVDRSQSEDIGMKTELICNKRVGSGPVKNILKTYCGLTPSKKDKFVLEVFQRLKDEIERGTKKIYLVGHSYGGSVVSRIAELINEEPVIGLFDNVHICTMGSIYVPKPDKVARVKNLYHLMLPDDVAMKCNGLRNNEVRDNLYWYDRPAGTEGAVRRTVFGTETQWKIHNSYNQILADIFNGKDSRIKFD